MSISTDPKARTKVKLETGALLLTGHLALVGKKRFLEEMTAAGKKINASERDVRDFSLFIIQSLKARRAHEKEFPGDEQDIRFARDVLKPDIVPILKLSPETFFSKERISAVEEDPAVIECARATIEKMAQEHPTTGQLVYAETMSEFLDAYPTRHPFTGIVGVGPTTVSAIVRTIKRAGLPFLDE